MPNPTCAAADTINGIGQFVSRQSPGPVVDTLVPQTAMHSPFIRASIFWTEQFGNVPPASCLGQIWLCSGQGASAVQQLKIHELAANGITVDTQSDAFVSSSVTLPGVNRPFNFATDSVRYISQMQGGTPDGISYSFLGRCCQTATGADCCAETLAKLDQIIGFVSAQLHNQP